MVDATSYTAGPDVRYFLEHDEGQKGFVSVRFLVLLLKTSLHQKAYHKN